MTRSFIKDAAMSRLLRVLLPVVLLLGAFASAHAQAARIEYYHLDAVGSVRAVTNEQGQVVLLSRDGLRQYRPPSFKPALNRYQANFDQRPLPRGAWGSNGHLDIIQ